MAEPAAPAACAAGPRDAAAGAGHGPPACRTSACGLLHRRRRHRTDCRCAETGAALDRPARARVGLAAHAPPAAGGLPGVRRTLGAAGPAAPPAPAPAALGCRRGCQRGSTSELLVLQRAEALAAEPGGKGAEPVSEPAEVAAAQEVAEVAAHIRDEGLDPEVAADHVPAVPVGAVALEGGIRNDDVPPRTEDVLGLSEGVRVRDGRGGHRAEADPGLPEPEREVHLVATDEKAHVRQADFEEDIGTDQGAVEEVSVVGQESDLFHLRALMRDLAAQKKKDS